MKQIKVVAFASTPRPKGNSDILAEEILKGAAESGAETEKVRVHRLTYNTYHCIKALKDAMACLGIAGTEANELKQAIFCGNVQACLERIIRTAQRA